MHGQGFELANGQLALVDLLGLLPLAIYMLTRGTLQVMTHKSRSGILLVTDRHIMSTKSQVYTQHLI
jgi:hypothetical protein